MCLFMVFGCFGFFVFSRWFSYGDVDVAVDGDGDGDGARDGSPIYVCTYLHIYTSIYRPSRKYQFSLSFPKKTKTT